MNYEQMSDCNRAAETLRRLVGAEGKTCSFSGITTACRIPDARLIVAAGDTDYPLDPFDLIPLAMRERQDVMGIWIDRILSGHVFLIDVVLVRDGQPEQFAAYRLWMKPGGRRSLVPAMGDGPTIAIDETGLILSANRPWRDEIGRLTGLSLGQAWIHHSIWRGTPFATPLDRNLSR